MALLNAHECPECGRAFTLEQYIPKGGMPVLIADGKPVRATRETTELLRLYRIPFVEQANAVSRAVGKMAGPLLQDIGGTLLVPRDRFFEAIDLLRRQKFDEPMPTPPDEGELNRPEWICRQCGEPNPGHFDLCWNCG